MTGALSQQQLDRVRAVAAVLIPGTTDAVAALSLEDFDDLAQRAAAALEGDDAAIVDAIEALPEEVTWESLAAFAEKDASSFDQVSLVAIGAYFMSGVVLASLGLPTGIRRPAKPEQVVDELDSGILDPVFERGCPVRTLEDVAGAADAH